MRRVAPWSWTRITALVLSLGLGLAAPAAAGPFRTAAYIRGDYATALRLLRPLGEKGLPAAQFMLGLTVFNGVPQDFTTAMTWFRKSADQRNNDAQLFLGSMYILGQGAPLDYVQVHLWFNLAAARASNAQMHGLALKYRDSVEAQMTPEQIMEAQKLARQSKPTLLN
jgi:hypothetical protein